MLSGAGNCLMPGKNAVTSYGGYRQLPVFIKRNKLGSRMYLQKVLINIHNSLLVYRRKLIKLLYVCF